MKDQTPSIGFGTGITTISQLKETEEKLGKHHKFKGLNLERKLDNLSNSEIKYDATGRMIRNDGSFEIKRKPKVSTAKRKKAILEDHDADFEIASNPEASGRQPSYALNIFSEVKSNEKTIEREAKKAGIDKDMVKAIVFLETTQGYYDRLHPNNKSIRPMNIRTDYWKGLGFSRKDLHDSEKNIQAGVELLKRIKKKNARCKRCKSCNNV